VGVAGSNPATPTIRFTNEFKRLVNFPNLRKNTKKSSLPRRCHSEIRLWRNSGTKRARAAAAVPLV